MGQPYLSIAAKDNLQKPWAFGGECNCPQLLLSALPHIARKGMCARETLVVFPLRVQSPARRRPVLRCKTVPTRKKTRRSVSFFVLVRPTGFEPAAFRVGVIRPSSRKALRRKGLIGVAQIPAILEKTSEALSDRASEVFCGSSQIVVCAPRRLCNLMKPLPFSAYANRVLHAIPVLR